MNNQTLLQELRLSNNDPDTKERIILESITILIQSHDYTNVFSIISALPQIWAQISTARITKIIKKTIEFLPKEKNEEILELISNLINWAQNEGRKLLKLDLEVKKVNFLLLFKKYKECLESISRILKELKKFDDKENQIRLFVYESKAYYELNDVTKARSAMTSARALAVSSYCATELQAQIDLLSGMFVCDEKCHTVAYSYFLESLDGFIISKDPLGATLSVRYLILSKIMAKKYEDVNALLKSKVISPFLKDEAVLFFLKIKEACKKRDVKEYQKILNENPSFLSEDTFVGKHLTDLYNILLENNILKIIEPYSNIKIEMISKKLDFSFQDVEAKLRKMILDSKIIGTIDNVNHSVLLFEKVEMRNDGEMIGNVKLLKEFVGSL